MEKSRSVPSPATSPWHTAGEERRLKLRPPPLAPTRIHPPAEGGRIARWVAVLLITSTVLACNLTGDGVEESTAEPSDVLQAPAPTPAASLQPCPAASGHLVTDLEVVSDPGFAQPEVRVPFVDPAFGTCLVRVTDHAADLPDGESPGGIKNEYARVQPFNADESRILVRGTSGSWYLYDAASLQPLGSLSLGIDPRWDAIDPNRLYSFDGTLLLALDVQTGEAETVHDFAPDFPGQSLAAVWMRYEGSPSADGRTWGMMAEDENWETVAFLVYDLDLDRITARRDLSGVPGAAGIDSVTISPSGDYFLADFGDSYCERGVMGTDQKPCGVMLYDPGLETGRGLLRIGGHMDLAFDVTDREVAVFQDLDTDTLSMVDLASGTVTPLWPIDFSHSPLGFHISGRAFERPGWAVISTYSGAQPPATWMDDQVFVIELKPDGRVVRLAHSRSRFADGPVEYGEKDYWAEPHASTNRDLTRILFTSNWGEAGTELVDMYQITLSEDWTEALP